MDTEQYLQGVTGSRQKRLLSLVKLVRSLYPDAEESMRYGMPTFERGEGWVAVANQKHHISLYTCSPQHLAEFRNRHPEAKCGKGCIRFPDRDDIPLEDLEPVIRSAMEFRH